MVIKIMQYFLHSKIPANTPNWLWYFHSRSLHRSPPEILFYPMSMMPMRAHMPTRVFRRFSRVVRGSGPVRVLVSPPRGRVPPEPAYLRDSRAIVTHPINLASSKKATCSCLVRFSTTFPCRIWTGLAWELKLEGLSALFS